MRRVGFGGLVVLCDGLWILACAALASGWLPVGAVAPPYGFLGPLWLALLAAQGYYDPARTFTAVRSAQELTRSVVVVLVAAMALHWFAPEAPMHRPGVYAWLGAGWAVLGLWRWALLRVSGRLGAPLRRQRVAVYGVGEEAARMAERLDREGRLAFERVGLIHAGPADEAPEGALGGVAELREIVNAHQIDTIVLAGHGGRDEALLLARRCHAMGLRVLQPPFNWGIVTPQVGFAQLGNLQLIDLSTFGYSGLARWTKRAVDLALVGLLGLALAPLLLAVALAVRLDSPGPALFKAPRVGKGGRSFPFYKFRSMVAHANAAKDALRAENELDGALFKIRDDPRVTRVGRVIRRWSLDELPQLYNVLRGDMDLVGPRPLPVEDLDGLDRDPELAYWFELRHQVRPGITGLWQVRGRAEVSFQEMVRLDLFYVQSWSLWLDLKILLLTIPAVLKGRGAS